MLKMYNIFIIQPLAIIGCVRNVFGMPGIVIGCIAEYILQTFGSSVYVSVGQVVWGSWLKEL